MTPEQSKYFDDMDNLFVHPGWLVFIKDLENNRDALRDSLWGITSERELFIAQGRKQTFDHIIGLEDLIDGLRASMTEDEE